MVATESYLGHKVTSVVIAAGPLLFGIESSQSLYDRIALSICSALGGSIAVAADKPATQREMVVRVGISLFSGFLFGEMLCDRFKTFVSGDKIPVYGGVGIVAYYVAGSLMRLLKGGLIDRWMAKKLDIPETKNEQPPA